MSDLCSLFFLRSRIVVRASTWERDSHELYDYESALVKRKTIDLNYSGKLATDIRVR